MKRFIGFLAALSVVTVMQSATATVPPTKMSFQGFLTDGGGVALNGTYDLTFRLYDASTGGSMLWSETHTGVTVSGGVFDVILGDLTSLNPFDFEGPLWLGIQVDADPELPLLEVTSSAYSMNSWHGGGWLDDGTVVQMKPGRSAVEINGDLNVLGSTLLGSSLAVGSHLTVIGNLMAQSNLDLTGDAIVAGNALVALEVQAGEGIRMGNSTSLLDGTIRYTGIDFEGRTGGGWVSLTSPGVTGNTLDDAYDQGGAGAGRTIIADAGAVHVAGLGGLVVDGLADFADDLTVAGNLVGAGSALINQTIDAGGNITAQGDLVGMNDLTLSGNANVGGGVLAGGELESATGIRMGNSTSLLDGTIRYTGTDFEGRTGGGWASLTSLGVTGNTLDDAYDQGGAGAGRTIFADAGAVHVAGLGGLRVDGLADFNSDVIASNLSLSGEANIGGDANIGGGVLVGGELESATGIRMGNSTSLVDGTIRYTGTDFEGRTGGGWASLTSPGATGNTLDDAYDQGGAGAGRTIFADAGAVHVAGLGGLRVDGLADFNSDVIASNLSLSGEANIGGDANIGGGVLVGGELESATGIRMGNSTSLVDGTIRYTGTDFEGRTGGGWASLTSPGATGNTLDDAYDQGGAGAGRTITADAGAVQIQGPGGLEVDDNITGNADLNLSLGNANVAGSLAAGGTGSFGSDLTVGGNGLVIGNLDVNGDHAVVGTVAAGVDLEVGGSINKPGPGPVEFSDIDGVNIVGPASGTDLALSGDALVNNTLTVGGISALNGDLDVTGNQTLSGNLFTLGEVHAGSGVVLGNSTSTVDGTLRFTGTQIEGREGGVWVPLAGGGSGNTLDDAYDQGGPGAGATITADAGPVTIAGPDGLDVFGHAAVIGDVTTDGSIAAALDLSANGNASITGTVSAGGAITAAGGLELTGSTITDVGPEVQVDDDLLVTGTVSALGDGAVVGNFSTDGDITAGTDLNVNGNSSLAGDVITGGQLTAGTNLNVNGTSSLAGDVTAAGNLTVGNAVNVTESVANSGTPISVENCTSSTSFVQLTTFDLPSQPSDRLVFMNVAMTAKGTSALETAVFIVRAFCYGTGNTTDLSDHYGSAPLQGAINIRNNTYSTYELNLGPFPASTGQRWRFIVYYRSRNGAQQACINNLSWEARSLRYEY